MNVMKKFTNKKIEETLYKPENLNFAVVLDDGELYIHCHGQVMLERVYNSRNSFCDVTEYIRDYVNSEYSKRDIARMIREAAESFYN